VGNFLTIDLDLNSYNYMIIQKMENGMDVLNTRELSLYSTENKNMV